MAPNELWAQKVAAHPDIIISPTEGERADLFRPHEIRRARRCLIELGTNSYFATELDAWHGKDVFVGYDLRDASRVWVREIDILDGERHPGRLICVAAFGGNKTRYVPLSMERAALEKRAKGRKRRLDAKLKVVAEELHPPTLFTIPKDRPIPVEAPEFDGADAPRALVQVARIEAARASANGRPIFFDDYEFALWISDHPSEATETDRESVLELLMSDASKNWLRIKGVDLDRLHAVLTKAA